MKGCHGGCSIAHYNTPWLTKEKILDYKRQNLTYFSSPLRDDYPIIKSFLMLRDIFVLLS